MESCHGDYIKLLHGPGAYERQPSTNWDKGNPSGQPYKISWREDEILHNSSLYFPPGPLYFPKL